MTLVREGKTARLRATAPVPMHVREKPVTQDRRNGLVDVITGRFFLVIAASLGRNSAFCCPSRARKAELVSFVRLGFAEYPVESEVVDDFQTACDDEGGP